MATRDTVSGSFVEGKMYPLLSRRIPAPRYPMLHASMSPCLMQALDETLPRVITVDELEVWMRVRHQAPRMYVRVV